MLSDKYFKIVFYKGFVNVVFKWENKSYNVMEKEWGGKKVFFSLSKENSKNNIIYKVKFRFYVSLYKFVYVYWFWL